MKRSVCMLLFTFQIILVLFSVGGCSSDNAAVTTEATQVSAQQAEQMTPAQGLPEAVTGETAQAATYSTQTALERTPAQTPREDMVVQWVEPALESLVREALKKPDGDIMQSELDDIWGIELIGDSHLYFNAKGGYEMYKNPETYFVDGVIDSDKLNNPAGVLLESDLDALDSIKDGTYVVKGQVHPRGTITSLADFSNFRDVKFLNVYKNDLTDLIGLESLEELVVLRLIECSIVDISELGMLEKVETLNLESNQIVDVSPLNNLGQLTWLSIMDNHVDNIEGFSALTNLVFLRLSHNPIESIEALFPLNNLLTLRIDYTKINNLSALTGKTSLNYLLMNHLDADRVDLEPLATVSNLKVLEVSQDNADLLNVRSLAELKQMGMLGILDGKQSAKLPDEDIDWLQAQLPKCLIGLHPI